MFELDKEVDAWCQLIIPCGFNQSAKRDELKDHLYCDIEQLQKDGLTDEQAFLIATERFGDVEELKLEHEKNINAVIKTVRELDETVDGFFGRWSNDMKPKKAALLIIVVSIVFAIAILLSTYLLENSQYAEFSQTAMYLLIAIWFVPFSYLAAAAGKGEKEKVS